MWISLSGLIAQTNTFPTTGNVGIGTTSPANTLHVNGTARIQGTLSFSQPVSDFLIGSTAGTINKLQTIASAGIDRFLRFRTGGGVPVGFAGIQFSSYDSYSWFAYAGQSSEFVISAISGNPTTAGSLGNPVFALTSAGHLGIGTSTPSNAQGWHRAMEILGTDHSKLLVSSVTNTVRVGIFSHSNWSGTGPRAIIGTESNHDLSFHTAYSQERMRIKTNGNVGIGVTNPANKLEVDGTIKTTEVNVTLASWADYVFDPAYNLMPLDELAAFVRDNRHLPEIPTEKDVQENGVDLGEMNKLLLKKVEELTLYVIQLEENAKRLESLEAKVQRLQQLEESLKILLESK